MQIFPIKEFSVIGQHGFIGSTVTKYLKKSYDVGETDPCETLINCAGWARIYEASQDPKKMKEVEDYTLERIRKISFDRLVHISTIHIECYPDSWYSIIKKRMEEKLLKEFPNTLILRVTGVIGNGMKKNAIYDMMNDKPLWVTEDSVYNYITDTELARIILYMSHYRNSLIINVGAKDSISVGEVAKILGKNPVYGSEKHVIKFDTSFLRMYYGTKTSKEYVQDYLKGTNENNNQTPQ